MISQQIDLFWMKRMQQCDIEFHVRIHKLEELFCQQSSLYNQMTSLLTAILQASN